MSIWWCRIQECKWCSPSWMITKVFTRTTTFDVQHVDSQEQLQVVDSRRRTTPLKKNHRALTDMSTWRKGAPSGLLCKCNLKECSSNSKPGNTLLKMLLYSQPHLASRSAALHVEETFHALYTVYQYHRDYLESLVEHLVHIQKGSAALALSSTIVLLLGSGIEI